VEHSELFIVSSRVVDVIGFQSDDAFEGWVDLNVFEDKLSEKYIYLERRFRLKPGTKGLGGLGVSS
jgi:hypothetical protein